MIQNESNLRDDSNILRLEVKSGAAGQALVVESGRRSMNEWSQTVWDFYLNRDHDDPVAPYGSVARDLLNQWGVTKSSRQWVDSMKIRLECSFEILGDISEAMWDQMREFNKTNQVSSASEVMMREETRKLNELWKETDFATRLADLHTSSDSNAFMRIKQKKAALQEVFELFSVQKALIRVMDQELKDQGVGHGARA